MNKPYENPERLLKFLLVEDDDDHAIILTRILERERIVNDVDRASDGVQALEYLKTRLAMGPEYLPDVILLDLKLPKKDGHEVLVEIKEDPKLRAIPVVVLTTSDNERDRIKAYEHYVNSYLVKPLDMMSFRKMVEDLSLYWGIWNRTPRTGEARPSDAGKTLDN